ncbi:MAG TPA: antibiotic biosynthesis monooxygenase [Ktedonobacteraceae bacterium]
MYGTIVRFRVKPGMEEQLFALQVAKDPGEVASYVYRMDADPSIFYLVSIFESKEAYGANADHPETDARYQHVRAYFNGEPEWHDGEIVFTIT